MKKLNKYWNLSWWYIFDFLDKKAHKLAIQIIWECETVSADIDYLWKIEYKHLEKHTSLRECFINDNKIIIYTNILEKIFARFIFIKKK